MRVHLYRSASAASFVLWFCSLSVQTAHADEPKLSISGYDPVAYFTDSRAVAGKPEFEYLWRKLRWRFASSEHRDLFAKEPGRFSPQYDGYCAMGAADGDTAHKDTVDPEAWAIVNGKLYLAHNRYWIERWKEEAADKIRAADAGWKDLAQLPDPIVVGPPCAGSPQTTIVALRGGGHWVVVGGQMARDENGRVVGKGDMRAQIEQVGKNVETCLAAAGAAVKDIMWTVNYVTDQAQFEKYSDLRLRYFGPPSPKSATVPVKQLATADFLVQVEAFAATK
jgi:enamine deaminase RidA (YjgF/YER057c/UK114 family)